MQQRRSSIKDIAARARDHAEAICARWLPGGKRRGSEWVVGDRTGASGESLRIHLSGEKAGIWSDFATGDKGGDLVALVAFVDGCAQGEAAIRLGKFLGMSDAAPRAQASIAAAPEWRPLLPVPASAPAPPRAHPKRGVPAALYIYRDEGGAVLGYVARWEAAPSGGKKEFGWLVFAEDARTSRREWRWQGFPAPRPLYGLEALCAAPSLPVVIVEGEKAAHAARDLLPDHLVLTWPGGSKAIDKVDFDPLRDRNVILWPDADEPGRTAMKRAAAVLKPPFAASVRGLSLDALALALGRMLPAGFDAADLLAAGWDATRMSEFLRGDGALVSARRGAQTDSAPAAPRVDGNYSVTDAGTFYLEPRRNGDEPRPVRICDPVEVVALARDQDSGKWSTLVLFRDMDKVWREELLPRRLFTGDGADAARMLVELGLFVEPGKSTLDRLKAFLASARPAARARLVETTGWHGEAYVFPDGVIGDAGERFIYAGARVARGLFDSRGTLSDWKKRVAEPARGNPRLMFALCVALAGPLLMRVGAASFAVHWTGDSSIGKSAALAAAGSVWGDPQRIVRSWRSTDNSLEYVAAQHCDGLLILDELKEVDPKQAGAIAYMLGNEKGKNRAHHAGGLREAITWRITMQSSGEIGLADHMASAGQKSHAGQSVRFIELPADAGGDHGMWNNIGVLPGGREFTDDLKKASRLYYGTAGRAFIAAIIENKDGLYRLAQQFEDELFRGHVPASAGGQVRRVARSFALAATAGELAIDWGIAPWKEGEALRAAGHMLRAWLRGRPTEGNLEDAQILAHVIDVMQRNWQARFIDWHRVRGDAAGGYEPPEGHQSAPDLSRMAAVPDALGFRKRQTPFDPTEPHYLYYIETERFRAEFCFKGGFDPRRVAALLGREGLLHTTEKSRWTVREDLPSGSKTSYCIDGRALAIKAEERAARQASDDA